MPLRRYTHEVCADSGHALAANAKAELAKALSALQGAENALVASRLDRAMDSQRRVEEEALSLTKNVNTLYQRAVKWKSEQKRFRSAVEVRITRLIHSLAELNGGLTAYDPITQGLDNFAIWAANTEDDLHAVAGNLEYVCAVLERENAGSNGNAETASSATQ